MKSVLACLTALLISLAATASACPSHQSSDEAQLPPPPGYNS